MALDASWQVQEAVYTAVAAAVAPTKVFDYVPQNETATSYVLIGDSTVEPDDSKSGSAQTHEIFVHAWSKETRGRRTVKQLLALVYGALQDEELSVTGFDVSECSFVGGEVEVDETELVILGTYRFQLRTEEA